MRRIISAVLLVLGGLALLIFPAKVWLAHAQEPVPVTSPRACPLGITLAYKGNAPDLERSPVTFDHDRHTKALHQEKSGDCTVCHVMKEADKRLARPEVAVFKFPKISLEEADKDTIMLAYHEACVSCHRKTAAQGKKTGPDIGLCGKCHLRKPAIKAVLWSWSPIFDYARHDRHLKAVAKVGSLEQVKVAGAVERLGPISEPDRRCYACHHTFDEKTKKLVYRQDTENACGACHKAQDDQNARSMRKVAHAACIGCHMQFADQIRQEAARQGRQTLTEEDKRQFGPIECSGCHGEHKALTPEEIVKIPRLVRGQKDVMDLAFDGSIPGNPAPSPTGRMKVVAYNHKAHEPRAQFCNTCHHHSLEKCSNCHTPEGDLKKGGGVTYERAFHKATAKQACVGCHETAKQSAKCSGCHQEALTQVPKTSCPVCHRGPSGGKPVDAAPLAITFDKEKVPETCAIKSLEKEYKPADLPHQRIVANLTRLSNASPLARVFHAVGGQEALCAGCHHKTDFSSAQVKKVPQCSTCHNRPFDPKELNKPGLLGAYHRQCVGCHERMKQKPAALECVRCHPAKDEVQKVEAATSRLGRRE